MPGYGRLNSVCAHQMTGGHPLSVAEIAAAIAAAVDRPTAGQRRLLDRVTRLSARLTSMQLHIALLGQFKRGKSTLANALIGYPVLSAGVLPLTAVSTFLTSGSSMRIRLKYTDGVAEDRLIQTLEELAAAIARTTTEEQNPENALKLERVDVSLTSCPGLEGITLIDTPGIGSTLAHNTGAANASLSECDAAIFVVGADPPITQSETQFLSSICRTVSRVIVVLNKVDLVAEADRQKSMVFLASILSQRVEGQIDPEIYAVSAKAALTARREGDGDALQQSGLPALEAHIRASLVSAKKRHLETSIASKLSDILYHLEADAAIMVRALALPLDELDEKIGIFELAVAEFIRERDMLQDRLSGEWRRAVTRLDELCSEAEKRARSAIGDFLADLEQLPNPDDGRPAVEATMRALFDREFSGIGNAIDADLNNAIKVHQQRYRQLAEAVREEAGDMVNAVVRTAASDDWFRIKREAYWVGHARIENLGSVTIDGIANLLPEPLRRRRHGRILREAALTAIARNIARLHWAMRQNIDDSFRRLLSSSSEAIDTSIEATRELLSGTSARRRASDVLLHESILRATASSARLTELREELDRKRCGDRTW